MATEGERIATLEAVLHELRGDVLDIKQEAYRSRERLHKIEGGQALLIMHDDQRATVAKERNKKQDRRAQLLLVLVTIGVLLEPILSHFVTGR